MDLREAAQQLIDTIQSRLTTGGQLCHGSIIESDMIALKNALSAPDPAAELWGRVQAFVPMGCESPTIDFLRGSHATGEMDLRVHFRPEAVRVSFPPAEKARYFMPQSPEAYLQRNDGSRHAFWNGTAWRPDDICLEQIRRWCWTELTESQAREKFPAAFEPQCNCGTAPGPAKDCPECKPSATTVQVNIGQNIVKILGHALTEIERLLSNLPTKEGA